MTALTTEEFITWANRLANLPWPMTLEEFTTTAVKDFGWSTTEGKHPKFFENLAAGKVELNYELIQARTNGNVTASNFRIAPPGGKIMLTWDGKGDLKITIVPKGK